MTRICTPRSTMRGQLDQWMQKTGDHGRRPEPARMYDSDMALYLDVVFENPSG